MHNFHVSLSAHISSLVEFDCKVISNIFGSMLAEKGYSRELISVSIVPVENDSKYEQKGYRKGQQLYTLVVTGSSIGNSALELGKILFNTLNNFTEKYATGYFLYSMYVEREDKKDFCSQSAQERVFHV